MIRGMVGEFVYFGDTCFIGRFFGKEILVKHDPWMGLSGKGPRVCVYCKKGVRG